MVIDRQVPVIDPDFIKSPFVDIPSGIYYNYSISGWINDVFSDLQAGYFHAVLMSSIHGCDENN